jgi:hypothetical protein
VLDVVDAREGAKREHESLVPVGLGHHPVTAGDLLALNLAAIIDVRRVLVIGIRSRAKCHSAERHIR